MLVKSLFLLEILLISSIHSFFFKKTDINFHFYNRTTPYEGIKIDVTDPLDVARSGFDPNKDTFIYFHGIKDFYLSNRTGQKIKNAILTAHDCNVLLFDWNKPSKILYPFVVLVIKETGDYAGQLLKQFTSLNLSSTTLCGHSVGSIFAGHAGNILSGQASKAIGLDPPSDFFIPGMGFHRMTPASAQFVHIIHTDDFAGNTKETGNADYYVNGGVRQKKCGFDWLDECSHLSAIDYYVESLGTNNFKAWRCDNYEDFASGLCYNNSVSYMGGYYIDTKARGTYYLNTNLEPPYGKG